jgi:hypothetical protein
VSLNQKYTDPFESPEYAAFVESMVPHCHCSPSHQPCDGVLAGGLCDNIRDDREDWRDEGGVEEEDSC